jgi:CTP:molybdopterin cytidylyltransferase MocA
VTDAGSTPGRGDVFATFRPRRGRRVAWAFAVGSLAVFGLLALLLPATRYQGWSVGDSLLLAGFGVLVALAMWRFARMRAVPSRSGLVVRNVLLTREVAWAEVAGVRFAGGDAWAWLDLDDGDQLAVMAIQRSDGAFARTEAARLAALVQARGGQRTERDRPPEAVGVVLAAGAGRRFGGPKALAALEGERLVDRAVRILRAGGCSDVLVVAGAAPVLQVDATVVTNVHWPTGMASSLHAGLEAAGRGRWDAAVLMLVDTPWIGPQSVQRLLDAHRRGAPAAQATYGGVPGHPVLLARETWPGVAATATGDEGARAWLRGHADDVELVDCDGTGDPRDVDRPEDLAGQ